MNLTFTQYHLRKILIIGILILFAVNNIVPLITMITRYSAKYYIMYHGGLNALAINFACYFSIYYLIPTKSVRVSSFKAFFGMLSISIVTVALVMCYFISDFFAPKFIRVPSPYHHISVLISDHYLISHDYTFYRVSSFGITERSNTTYHTIKEENMPVRELDVYHPHWKNEKTVVFSESNSSKKIEIEFY